MNFPEVEKQDLIFSGLNYSESKAKAFIFGVQLEETVSGKKGTAKGPDALRKASEMIESFSIIAGKEFFENCPALDLGNLKLQKSLGENLQNAEKTITGILEQGKIPIMLGGEHTITLSALRALKEKEFVLLHFDAHPDLRQELEGNELCHATFLHKAIEEGIVKEENILQVGVRTAGKEEFEFLENSKIKFFKTRDLMNKEFFESAKRELQEFTQGKEVYVSFDLDVLEANLVPATGTLEPGGLSFWQAIELLESVKGKIVGLDLVEVAPDENMLTETIAAVLLRECLAGLDYVK